MLGFDALGRLALGQIADDGPTSAVLAADAGAFALTGVSAPFRTTQAAAAASYALGGEAGALVGKLTCGTAAAAVTGADALFSLALAADTAGHALTGNAAVMLPSIAGDAGAVTIAGGTAAFTAALGAATGAYEVSWQTFLCITTFAAEADSFTLAGEDTYLSLDVDPGGIGGAIVPHRASGRLQHQPAKTGISALMSSLTTGDEHRSGTPFTRQRYRELIGAAEEVAAAERRALALEAARRIEDQANAARAQLRAFAHALDAAAGAQRASDAMRNAAQLADLSAAAQRAQADRDEEEAIVQLLLAA